MGLPKIVRVEEVDRADLPGSANAAECLASSRQDLRPTAPWRSPTAIKERWPRPRIGASRRTANPAPLAPGDIAILCATNNRCLKLSAALASFGLKVALERDGLFGTPEVRLALAALRWCADQRDSLALAEMAHLLHAGDGQPEWFEASLEDGSHEALAALVPMAEDLRAIARRARTRRPAGIRRRRADGGRRRRRRPALGRRAGPPAQSRSPARSRRRL